MGFFTRRRAPAFTSATGAAGGHDSGHGHQLILAETNLLNNMASSHPEAVVESPVVTIARRLSHALAYTLPSPSVPSVTEAESRFDEKRKCNPSGMTYDTVSQLKLEADELASDEEIEYRDQDVKSLVDDHKRWSAVLREAGEERPRHGRKRRRRRRSVSHEMSKSRLKPSSSRSPPNSGVNHDLEAPLTVSVPPASSPFPRLSVQFQDSSQDEQESTFENSTRLIPNSSPDLVRTLAVPIGDGFDALDVMADYLFRYGCEKKKWFQKPLNRSREQWRNTNRSDIATGVCIRAKTGVQRAYPLNMPGLVVFETAVTALNPEVSHILLT